MPLVLFPILKDSIEPALPTGLDLPRWHKDGDAERDDGMRTFGKTAAPSPFAILARRQDDPGTGLVCLGGIGSAQARIQDELFAVGCLGCAWRPDWPPVNAGVTKNSKGSALQKSARDKSAKKKA